MKRLVSMLTIFYFAAPAAVLANPPVQRRAVQSPAVVVDNRVTVVPFAVPVAVPVATIQQPLLLYSYRQHVMPGAQLAHPVNCAPGDAGTMPSAVAPSANNAAAKILAERCAKCHSGTAAKGQLSMFDAAGQLLARLPRQMILEMVEPDSTGTPRMPPGELPKLSSEEVQTLRDWAKPPRDAVY